jgi:putative acetyltransferase
VHVRRERATDHDAVRQVHRAAFRPAGAAPDAEVVEARLTDELRADAGFLPHLSLVAVADGAVVGHVLATRGWLEPLGAPGLGLGPLGVVPDHYRRFDFAPASELGIEAPDPQWGRYFQARRLSGPPVHGTFRYAAPFDGL